MGRYFNLGVGEGGGHKFRNRDTFSKQIFKRDSLF